VVALLVFSNQRAKGRTKRQGSRLKRGEKNQHGRVREGLFSGTDRVRDGQQEGNATKQLRRVTRDELPEPSLFGHKTDDRDNDVRF